MTLMRSWVHLASALLHKVRANFTILSEFTANVKLTYVLTAPSMPAVSSPPTTSAAPVPSPANNINPSDPLLDDIDAIMASLGLVLLRGPYCALPHTDSMIILFQEVSVLNLQTLQLHPLSHLLSHLCMDLPLHQNLRLYKARQEGK